MRRGLRMFEQIQRVEVGTDDVILVRVEQQITADAAAKFEEECKKSFMHDKVCVLTGPSQIDVVAKRKKPSHVDEEFMSYPEFIKTAALAILKLTVMPTIQPRPTSEDEEETDA